MYGVRCKMLSVDRPRTVSYIVHLTSYIDKFVQISKIRVLNKKEIGSCTQSSTADISSKHYDKKTILIFIITDRLECRSYCCDFITNNCFHFSRYFWIVFDKQFRCFTSLCYFSTFVRVPCT